MHTHTALVEYFTAHGARPCNVWTDSTGESGFAVYYDGDLWSVTVQADGTWSSRVQTFSDAQLESLRRGD